MKACCGWARESQLALQDKSILDWPLWATSFNPSLEGYKLYVESSVVAAGRESWKVVAGRHRAQVPYLVFTASPGGFLEASFGKSLPWDVQLGIRSLIRVRAGLLDYGHVGGRRSAARYRSCVICDAILWRCTNHELGVCVKLASQRAAFVVAAGMGQSANSDSINMAILRTRPGVHGFVEAVRLARVLDELSCTFWRERGYDVP